MTLTSIALRQLALLCACALAACESVPVTVPEQDQPPPKTAPSPPPVPRPPSRPSTEGDRPSTQSDRPSTQSDRARPSPSKENAWEWQHREHAESLMRDGRWREAALDWELLLLLRPDNKEYEENLAITRNSAHNAATALLASAVEARRQGDIDRAATLYLRALNVEPQNTTAAQALRQLEQERPRNNGLLQPPKANAPDKLRANTSDASPVATASTAERMELEPGIMLYNQGDFEGSIQMLQEYLQRAPQSEQARKTLGDAYLALGNKRLQEGRKEEALVNLEKARKLQGKRPNPELSRAIQSARKQLGDDYYQQGLRVQRTNLNEAVRLFQKALEYDPGNTQVTTRLQQTRKMQENLDSIQGGEDKR